jgi:tripartite ATP-independent transporter DctM subunit
MGETIPPSIGILVLASVSSLSIGTLFLAGFLPAFVLAVALIFGIWLRNGRKDDMARQSFCWRDAIVQSARSLPAMIMPVMIVGGMVFGIGTPTEISAFAVLYGLAVSIILYRSIALGPLWEILRDATLLSGAVLLIISSANLLSGAIAFDDLPARIGAALSAQSRTVFWIVSAGGLVIAGSVLEGLAGLTIFAPMLLPLAAGHGINTIHYAIVLLVAMGIGSFAPPIGVGLYIACAAAGGNIEETIGPSAFYTLMLLVGMVVLILFPQITLTVPLWLGAG